MKADYSFSFINIVINAFQNGKDHRDESFIIPPELLGLSKLSLPLKWPTVNSIKLNQNIFC